MDAGAILFVFVYLFGLGFLFFRISDQAGYSPWLGLLALVPVVNLFMLLYFAFADWPSLARIRNEKCDLIEKSMDLERANKQLQQQIKISFESGKAVATKGKDSPSSDEEYYSLVADELRTGSTKPGLWLKSEIFAEGDPHKQRREYIKLRVAQLTNEPSPNL
jgi:hypothetical protein